ncbi:MAG: response regulator transcription factor [Oscillochloris sp.]|nr:response regulator transcription factor [Oscillochloris sp.]
MTNQQRLNRRTRNARLVIADDHDLTRMGLRGLLADERGLELVGEARDGMEALEMCRRLQPDMAILDVRMPRLDGLATTRAIKRDFPRMAVLLVSLHATPEYILDAIEAGASGYVLKDAPLHELASAIHQVLRGESMLTEPMAARMLRRLSERKGQPTTTQPTRLTLREMEVLRLVAQGKTNRVIAEDLKITSGTVKLHVEHIIGKLEVSDRTQAAVRAIQLGLLRADYNDA